MYSHSHVSLFYKMLGSVDLFIHSTLDREFNSKCPVFFLQSKRLNINKTVGLLHLKAWVSCIMWQVSMKNVFIYDVCTSEHQILLNGDTDDVLSTWRRELSCSYSLYFSVLHILYRMLSYSAPGISDNITKNRVYWYRTVIVGVLFKSGSV